MSGALRGCTHAPPPPSTQPMHSVSPDQAASPGLSRFHPGVPRQGGEPIRDWSGLLQPALKGRIAFVDSPREFVGAALKTLGLDINATSTHMQRRGVTSAQLQQRLDQLRSQVHAPPSLPFVLFACICIVHIWHCSSSRRSCCQISMGLPWVG